MYKKSNIRVNLNLEAPQLKVIFILKQKKYIIFQVMLNALLNNSGITNLSLTNAKAATISGQISNLTIFHMIMIVEN